MAITLEAAEPPDPVAKAIEALLETAEFSPRPYTRGDLIKLLENGIDRLNERWFGKTADPAKKIEKRIAKLRTEMERMRQWHADHTGIDFEGPHGDEIKRLEKELKALRAAVAK